MELSARPQKEIIPRRKEKMIRESVKTETDDALDIQGSDERRGDGGGGG